MSASCEICGQEVNGFNCQMVMLRNSLWKEVSDHKRIICLDCIEKKLGRPLTTRDLLYRVVRGRLVEWIPVNMRFYYGREHSIEEADRILNFLKVSNHFIIPLASYNPENIKEEELTYDNVRSLVRVPMN